VRTIGIDLGGTKCHGLMLDSDGTVLAEQRVPTPRGADAVVDTLLDLAAALEGEVGDRVAAIGVGVPGLVERTGVLRFAPNLPGVVDLDLAAALRDGRPDVSFCVENDATCAGWGERAHGAAVGTDTMMLVTLGTGIGGGIIVDGNVFRGAYGFAGEVGHMVVDPNGPACPCGKRGCWERYASGSGLGRLAREAANAGRASRMVELAGGDPENVKGEHATGAAAEGDNAAKAVMADFAWWLALGLTNLANIFDPECFVVGGGLVSAGDLILAPARAAFAGLVVGAEHRPDVAILPALLGERAGAIGAAALARR
jgi:glucokinase